MPSAIEVQNLRKEFDSDQPIFQSLNFSIKSGERVAILGQNGCGKTTLLKILVNLIVPTSGTIKLFGQSADLRSKKFRQTVAWVPASDQGFYSRLTGLENLLFFAALDGFSKSQVLKKIDQFSHFISLEEAQQTPFFLCSSGMKQALSLARAFLSDPKILVLDEPTRSLDLIAAQKLREGLKSWPGSPTIVFSTHVEEEASYLASRQFELSLGHMIEIDRSEIKKENYAVAAL